MDAGTVYTDRKTQKVEKQITKVYEEARKDIREKIEIFNKKYEKKYAIHMQELKDGKITQDQFDAWVEGQVFQGKQWMAKEQQIANTIHHANEVAAGIVNGNTQSVFATNATYMSYHLEHSQGIDFGFGIYDGNTVSRLITEDPKLLPEWKINEPKDYVWNRKKLNNALTQGIIQGESLDKIASRIANSLAMQNKNASLTFARTAMTGAQNAGRNQSLSDAKKKGINVIKQWMATFDSRTRDSHRDIDGEKISTGDRWHPMKFSNGCRYPGDPEGPPHEVYNCRCTLVGEVEDYPDFYERYDNIDGKPVAGMTYTDWLRAKTTGGNLNKDGLVYNSTFKTVAMDGVHWTRLTRENGYTNLTGSNIPRDVDVFTLDDGLRVVYPSDLNISEQDLQYGDIVRQLYNIPRDFRSVIQQEIQVVDYENPSDPYWRTVYKNFTKSYATGGEFMTFYAYTGHNMSYLKDTLCHEGGHHFDEFIAGTKSSPFSSSQEWSDAVNADLALCGWQSVTKYGENAMVEDFAESCMMYYSRDRDLMERQFPNRLKIIKRLVTQYGK